MAINWFLFENEVERLFVTRTANDFSDFSEKFIDIFQKNTLNVAQTPFGNLLNYGNYSILAKNIELFLNFNFNIQNIRSDVAIVIKNLKDEIKNKAKNNEINPNDIVNLKQNAILYSVISTYIDDFNKKVNVSPDDIEKYIDTLNTDIEKIDIDNIAYLYLELSFIKFWLTSKFTPFPSPPPLISPLFGPLLVTPGIFGILSYNFKYAFSSFDSKIAAAKIIFGLKSHFSTISGTYSGLIASPSGPIPSTPIPWVGVF